MSTTLSAVDSSITYSPQSAWLSKDGTMATISTGVTAELSFTGEFVQVYGPLLPGSLRAVSTYSLDNGPPLVFNSSANASNKEIGSVFAFYQSPLLVVGVHSLLITSIENSGFFILDSIVYGSNNTSPSASPGPFSTTGIPAHPTPSFSSFPSSSPVADSDVSSSKPPVGGIVGGTVAALVLLVVVALIIFRRRRREISSLGEHNSDTEYPPTPEPFLLGRPFESRNGENISLSGDPREGSIVSTNFPSGLNVNSDPSSNSVIWGSIPQSVSTTSTVVGDRSETSFVDEKDARVLGNSPPMPVTPALNYRSTVVSAGSRATWNTRASAPPPSWTGLSDPPPSYTTGEI